MDGIKVKKEEEMRKGPWSLEEDTILTNYVAAHGDRLWNSLARSSGLRRSGKSCRLRWLNYLRPNVRRGNFSLQEQITILDLHSRWGNRWSRIAQELPGRTDNEIKNYWRTRVTKQAKQLNCDVNSKKFRDALRYVWMPLLLERLHPPKPTLLHSQQLQMDQQTLNSHQMLEYTSTSTSSSASTNSPGLFGDGEGVGSGDLLLDALWNDDNIWILPPLCDDLGI